MRQIPLLVVGAGPAGLAAAYRAAALGVDVLVLERQAKIGGQLVKQTHKFFGSEAQFASTRGIEIAKRLQERLIDLPGRVEILTDATVLGLYEDGVVSAEIGGRHEKFRPQALVVATGAYEKTLPFPGNDLPGVYGAGAVQTLMNEFGVRPGRRCLMIGAGNIGLIVAYQLLQAGVEVAAIIDAAPRVGGYTVHASKIRRAGVPIQTGRSVKLVSGAETVQQAVTVAVDEAFQPLAGSEEVLDVDLVCVAVGLSPLAELLFQLGVDMLYIAPLGGFVPLRDASLETSVAGLFVAGDVAGIEEASSAMVEGEIAGLAVAEKLGFQVERAVAERENCLAQLRELRAGPTGGKTRAGLALAGVYG